MGMRPLGLGRGRNGESPTAMAMAMAEVAGCCGGRGFYVLRRILFEASLAAVRAAIRAATAEASMAVGLASLWT